MSRRHRRDRPREEYGQSWEMAAALWDGPRFRWKTQGWTRSWGGWKYDDGE